MIIICEELLNQCYNCNVPCEFSTLLKNQTYYGQLQEVKLTRHCDICLQIIQEIRQYQYRILDLEWEYYRRSNDSFVISDESDNIDTESDE